MRVLSVDFGTSNTVAVLSAHGRAPRVVEVDGSATMPSAVFVGNDGGIVVGRDAERQARLSPSRFEPHPKRRIDEGTLLLGETVVTVTDAIAAVLFRVAEETRRQLAGAQPDEVRLTHPAQWGPIRRNSLLSAARLAGFTSNLELIPEPVAAAAHFASFPGRSLEAGQALAVYDLGAGTFDCAVVGTTQDGFNVLAEDGLPDFGGSDVDYALLEYVRDRVAHRDPEFWQRFLRPTTVAERRAQRALREDVRASKEALSRHMQTEVPMPEPFDDVLVTRAELEDLVRPSLARSVDLLASTIRSTGLEPAKLAGIYLVGGASRIPLVATLISQQLGVVATSLDQPETAVALGGHHIRRDGSALRTEDLSSQFADLPEVGLGAAAVLSGTSTTGPVHSVNPQSTQPHSVHTHQASPPPLGALAAPVAAPGTHAGHDAPSSRLVQLVRRSPLVLAGAAAGVLVLLIATIAVVATNATSAGQPAAEQCLPGQPQGRDVQGFTPCLRQLAGAVPTTRNCVPGWQQPVDGLRELSGTVVSCAGTPDGSMVVYTQAESVEAAQARADLLLSFHGVETDAVAANWAGNGLSGEYRAVTSLSHGSLVFTVSDRPLVGLLLVPNTTKQLRPENLADTFERDIQPGTA